jgi:hypothetical protein
MEPLKKLAVRSILIGVTADTGVALAALTFGTVFIPIGMAIGGVALLGGIIGTTVWSRDSAANEVIILMTTRYLKSSFK